MLPEIPHAQQVILTLKQRGISHVVISPGSRNAPLTLGFSADSFFTCYSVVDERCASHFALGMAQQLRIPVALLCTSGSALLNYYPAVTEAYYSEIPLIVLSADRPSHKIDIGDGQTIRQQGIYSNHILYDAQLHLIDDVDDQSDKIIENTRFIHQAIDTAKNSNGPVHLNIPFEEPLYNVVEKAVVSNINVPENTVMDHSVSQEFYNDWNKAVKKLVILATLDPEVLSKDDVDRLLKDPSVLVLSEVSANVVHPDIVYSIDSLLAPIEPQTQLLKDLVPDLVVTIGGMIVSKKIKQFLRKYKVLTHYHIGETRANDTFYALKDHIKVDPRNWIHSLAQTTTTSDYQDKWMQHFKENWDTRDVYFKDMTWCDFKAFDLIFNMLPDHIQLQLGNSSTIRYAQLFQMNTTHQIFSNRGTSGIDGSTSTAIGASVINERPTILITGDLSFFYDANGLWNNYIPDDFKIIVINNSGGGIFRILPGDKTNPNFERFFETPHQLDASHLCKMYGLDYHRVEGEHAFAKAYNTFITANHKPQLLEIFTPRPINDTVLLDYFKFLR